MQIHTTTDTLEVPSDFPDLPYESALSGAELKFSVVRDTDGRYRTAGSSLRDRQRNFEYCKELIAWGVPFLTEKAQKPKYQNVDKQRLARMLATNLRDDLNVPDAFRPWVIGKIAEQLGWSVDTARL